MRGKNEKSAAKRGAEADRPTGKVFVGFWTLPSVRSSIKLIASMRRQSASALLDEIATDFVSSNRNYRGVRR